MVNTAGATQLGYSPETLGSTVVFDRLGRRDRAQLKAFITALQQDPEATLPHPLQWITQQGDRFRAQVSGQRLQGQSGADLFLLRLEPAPPEVEPAEPPQGVNPLEPLNRQTSIDLQNLQLYEQTRRQAQRESLLNQLVEAIRKSLDLDTTLQRAAEAIQRAFQVSRCIVGLYHESHRQIEYNAIALAPNAPPPPITCIPVTQVPRAIRLLLSRGTPFIVPNVASPELRSPYQTLMQQQQVQAILIGAIRLDGKTIGTLSLHQCDRPRDWTEDDIILIQAVAAQLAVAIQQARLYQQVQQLNITLEQQVQEQTAQLREALDLEATLKRITDKVRDSLDEDQILETAVQELARALKVDCCNTGIYDAYQTRSTITHEVTQELAAVKDMTFYMRDFSEVYDQLIRGQSVAFCWTQTLSARPVQIPMSVFACPILDNQEALGDLWLFKQWGEAFKEVEIRLVQQVANQCAIAIRQARLYQAVQAQVEEYERLHRLKDDFLSTVSHELRTPMTNIRMATQMLEVVLGQVKDSDALSQRTQRYFQILRDECQRELSLINDLLDLSRLDAGTRPLSISTLDLHTWIPRLTEPFEERIRNQQQQLRLSLAPKLPQLTTDVSALERIVIELLNNACKYTPAGEEIAIAAKATAKTLKITVSNSGVEISAAEQGRIFDKFYRIPHNDPWKHGGTGLGLALVKKLVEQIGATIQVSSDTGQTHFTVSFSLQTEEGPS